MSPREALKSGTWIIESFNGKSIKSPATLTFNKNTFNAKICNTMNGQYGVTSNVLVFRKVISTMMYCDGDIMLIENALHFARAKFSVGSTNLTITTKK
jgi:heat shock protein HslJ